MDIEVVLKSIVPVVVVILGVWWYMRYRNKKKITAEIMTRVNVVLQPKVPEKLFIGLKDGWWH
jgi:cytochrome oxidase assembly protein ShyY1